MHFGTYKILEELPGSKEIWGKVLETLERLPELPMGRTDIVPGVIYVNKESYETRSPRGQRPEMHQLYLDVQTLLSGMELIRCYDPAALSEEEPYDQGRDIAFFKAGATASQSGILDPGHIAVIPPGEAHASQMEVFAGETMPVVKAVVKVLASAVFEEWRRA